VTIRPKNSATITAGANAAMANRLRSGDAAAPRRPGAAAEQLEDAQGHRRPERADQDEVEAEEGQDVAGWPPAIGPDAGAEAASHTPIAVTAAAVA
jgi:hypothetical protein